MKPSSEILAAHTNDDGDLDFEAVIQELASEMSASRVQISLRDIVMLQQEHLSSSVMWILSMVISALNQMGAMTEEEAEENYQNGLLGLQLDWLVRNYDLMQDRSNASKLIVARNVPPAT